MILPIPARRALRRRALAPISLAVLALAPGAAAAAPADLDPAYGQGGKAILPIMGVPVAAAVQPDGKLVIAGNTLQEDVGVWRLNVDGTPDRSFDGDGAAVVDFGADDYAARVALQPDGKVVVSARTRGSSATGIARLTATGGLDATFDPGSGDGDGRKVLPQDTYDGNYVGGLLVQPDGRLVITGYSRPGTTADIAALVLKENGALDDATFEPADFDGRDEWSDAAAFAPNGKLVLAGSSKPVGSNATSTAIARYGADRKLDASFGELGRVILPGGELQTMLVQPDGGILLVRRDAGKAIVTRLTPAGEVDESFGDGGKAAADFEGGEEPLVPVGAALTPDGGVVLTTTNAARDAFAVARLDAKGRPDPRFGAGGRASVRFDDLAVAGAPAIQPDGKIVIAGALAKNLVPRPAVARLLGDFVAPASGGDPGTGNPGPGPVADTQPPALTRLRITRKVAGQRPRIRFTLSEPARVRLGLVRKGRRPVRFSVQAQAGANRIRAPRRTKAGRYRLTAFPVDAAGNAGQPARVRFTVAAPAARR